MLLTETEQVCIARVLWGCAKPELFKAFLYAMTPEGKAAWAIYQQAVERAAWKETQALAPQE